jgi:hypothetical protein
VFLPIPFSKEAWKGVFLNMCLFKVLFSNTIFHIFSTNLHPFHFNSILIQLLNWNSIQIKPNQIPINVFEFNSIWKFESNSLNLH